MHGIIYVTFPEITWPNWDVALNATSIYYTYVYS